MKKILINILLVLVAITAMGQTHKADTLNQRVFDAKVREMVYRLNISDEQKPKFIEIYRRYSTDMIAAWGEHKRPSRPTTTEEAVDLQKRRLERQQRAQNIRMRYVDEFATVLNATQLNRFYDVENKIQQKLKERHDRINHKHSMKDAKKKHKDEARKQREQERKNRYKAKAEQRKQRDMERKAKLEQKNANKETVSYGKKKANVNLNKYIKLNKKTGLYELDKSALKKEKNKSKRD
ncbi:MAG: cell envelope integrity protein TolA, partial [Muribaculaceae bacterium]|nr:cell envelope integrity protein TolA [Muribaculaceae bacterium]